MITWKNDIEEHSFNACDSFYLVERILPDGFTKTYEIQIGDTTIECLNKEIADKLFNHLKSNDLNIYW